MSWLWRGYLTADDLLELPAWSEGEGRAQGGVPAAARAFLQRVLADGPKSWGELVAAGEAEGLTAGLLRKARKGLGLAQVGESRAARWALPEANA
jgi:hypothetical protein